MAQRAIASLVDAFFEGGFYLGKPTPSKQTQVGTPQTLTTDTFVKLLKLKRIRRVWRQGYDSYKRRPRACA